MSGLSVLSRKLLHIDIKMIFEFYDISMWTRHFWKTRENVSVDGECFETNTQFLNLAGLIVVFKPITERFSG